MYYNAFEIITTITIAFDILNLAHMHIWLKKEIVHNMNIAFRHENVTTQTVLIKTAINKKIQRT